MKPVVENRVKPATWGEITGSHDEWNRRVEAAEDMRRVIVKLHRQMYFTNKDAVLPMLRRAHRLAKLKYTEHIVALARMAPQYIYRLHAVCLRRQKFLERKLDMMQKSWREEMFEQFQETLVQYELTCEQIWALKVGVEAGAEEWAASGRIDGAGGSDGSPVPASTPAVQGELNLVDSG